MCMGHRIFQKISLFLDWPFESRVKLSLPLTYSFSKGIETQIFCSKAFSPFFLCDEIICLQGRPVVGTYLCLLELEL